MKNLKKMLVAICILAVLCTGVIMTVIAETGPTGSVSEAQGLLDAVAATEDLGEKRTAMDALDAYMNENTFDTEAEDYIAFVAAYEAAEIELRVGEIDAMVQAAESAGTTEAKEAALATLAEKPVSNAKLEEAGILDEIDAYKFSIANSLLENVGIEKNGNTAFNREKLNKLNAFIRVNPLNEEHADYEAFNTEYLAKVKEHDDATKAAYEALENDALPSEYELTDRLLWDMETDKTTPNLAHLDNGGQVVYNEGPYDAAYIVTEENGNRYVALDYNTQTKPGNSVYITALNKMPNGGFGNLVFDFNIRLDEQLGDTRIHFEGSADCAECGNKVYWAMFLYDPINGNVRIGFDVDSNPLVQYQTVIGEWTHFTFVYNAETCMVDVYIDYSLIGSAPIYNASGDINHKDHTPKIAIHFPRFAASPKTPDGIFGVDDFTIYRGSGIRTLDKLSDMTDVEFLAYCSEYYVNEERPVNERVYTYNKAEAILSKYITNPDGVLGNEDDVWNLGKLDAEEAESVRASADVFWNYNMGEVVEILKTDNLETYIAMEASAAVLPRGLSTKSISDRQNAVDAIDAFINECGIYINTEDARYAETEAKVNVIRAKLKADSDILNFNKYIGRYENAIKISSLVAMRRHITDATAIYEKFNIYVSEIIVSEDEAIKAEYAEFLSALEVYNASGEALAKAVRDDNAQKIIDCLSFISMYGTTEEWEENYAYMERYVLIIRNTIYEDNYTKDYAGLDRALNVYYPINEYFYEKLQNSHIAEISRCTEKYVASDSYIERVGLIAYIEKYLANNDIDEENEQIANLIVSFETYKGEIKIQEENYADLLDQNTVIFVNFVEELKTCVDYASMKEVYEKAEIYYYSMNVSADYVQDAILDFDEYTVLLEKLEESTALFVGYAKQISGATGQELYAALVNCSRYADDVEVTISEEAAEMYEAYNEAYELYTSSMNVINGEIAETVIAMGSARANCGIAPIVSVMIGIIA